MGTDTAGVDEEIEAIRQSLALDQHRVEEPFFRKRYRTPILLAIAIAMFNQLSGINALLYYSKAIFLMAGAGTRLAMLNTVLLGLTNLVVTVLGMALIDRIGRRKLMLIGSIGYIVSLSAAAWTLYAYAPAFRAVAMAIGADRQEIPASAVSAVGIGGIVVLASLILFIVSHAIGQGTVIWVFIGEVFPNRVRAGTRVGQFDSLDHGLRDYLDFSRDRRPLPRARLRLLRRHDGAATALGALGDAQTKGVPLEEIQKRLGIE